MFRDLRKPGDSFDAMGSWDGWIKPHNELRRCGLYKKEPEGGFEYYDNGSVLHKDVIFDYLFNRKNIYRFPMASNQTSFLNALDCLVQKEIQRI